MNPFNLAAGVSVATAGFAAAAAVTSWVVGRAQGWRELRWFSLVGACTAAYSLGNVATVLGAPDPVVLAASRVQLAALLLDAWALAATTDHMTGVAPGRRERLLRLVLPAGALLALVPGLAYTGPVTSHGYPPWGAVYRDPQPTPLASALYVGALALGPVLVVRLWRAHRRGVPYARRSAASIVVLTALGVNDALSISRLVETPYLLDVGALLPLGALAWSHAGRFLDDAAALVALRGRLEALVEQRTLALSRSNAARLGAERLAGLGRVAGGLAHQVNNPASVVQSSLAYLQAEVREGRVPPDAAQVLDEALAAMHRITSLVRKLVDASRAADRPAVAASPLGPAVVAAVEEARGAAPAVTFEAQVAPGLTARMERGDLEAVLGALLSNAGAAFPPGARGRVEVRATARDGAVVVEVEDTGAGMSAEVQRQAFEPFFTTRAAGHGAAGLGLPVARTLVEAAGGRLSLWSREGHGTRVTLELPEARAQEAAEPPEPPGAPAPPGP